MSSKSTTRKRVTIVDDDPGILKIVHRKIKMFNPSIQVDSFTSPIDALFHIRRYKPRLVITDYEMPEMTGDTLAESIRSYHKDVPIILFSGTLRKPTFDFHVFVTKGSMMSLDIITEVLHEIF